MAEPIHAPGPAAPGTTAAPPAAFPREAHGLDHLDWVVLFVYILILAITAWVVSRRPKDADAFFTGGRSMPVWAVCLSIIATSLSAATFIGAPAQAFGGDLTYLSANIGAVIAVILVGRFFITAFYRHNVVTVYQLLTVRFGPAAAMAASWTFLIGRVLANGARLYIAALPLALLIGGTSAQGSTHDQQIAILILTVLGIGYALVGGIASVIWTDVVQMVVLVGATLCACALVFHRIPLTVPHLVDVLAAAPGAHGLEHSKLTLFSLSTNLHSDFTVLTALTGWVLFNLAAYGTDQDLAQRMLTCKSAAAGGRSAFFAILVGIPISALFMIIGLLLYVFYMRPDVMGPAAPAYPAPTSDVAFLTFILCEIPSGLRGLMLAGLFAVAFTSLLSALNAMASAVMTNLYRPFFPQTGAKRELAVGRLAVIGSGILVGSFAWICIVWRNETHETLLSFALGVMSFAYAGLLAVFLTALMTTRGSAASAITALVTGAVVIACLQEPIWHQWAPIDAVSKSVIPTLASSWRLVIATAIAFVVCCLGTRSPENLSQTKGIHDITA